MVKVGGKVAVVRDNTYRDLDLGEEHCLAGAEVLD